MRAVVLKVASAVFGVLVATVGLTMARGELYYYSSELHSLSPPPLWKSVVVVGLLIAAFIAPCWIAYRLIRYAIRPVRSSN